MIFDSLIISCIFEQNLGHTDFQEALFLLFEGKGGDRLCLILSRIEYEKFSQSEVDDFIQEEQELNLKRLSHCWDNYPLSPNDSSRNDLLGYIISILEWSKSNYIQDFQVEKKEVIETCINPKMFDATKIPPILT